MKVELIKLILFVFKSNYNNLITQNKPKMSFTNYKRGTQSGIETEKEPSNARHVIQWIFVVENSHCIQHNSSIGKIMHIAKPT